MDKISCKIRLLRTKKGLTLKELSEKTSLSIGFLSQVERGSSSLAITSLKKIADALDVDMTYFFQEEIESRIVMKKEDQQSFQLIGSDVTYSKLSGNFQGRMLEAVKATLQPSQKDEISFSHPGEEFYYILKGAILFHINEEEYFVREGDSIHFSSNRKHFWENPLPEESTLLCVYTPTIL